MKRNSKIAHMVNRSTVAIFLVIMMIISSFSAIAVTSDIFKSSASKDVEMSGSVEYESNCVYLVDSANWTNIHCYAYKDDNNKNADWPGKVASLAGTYDGSDVYKYKITSSDYVKFIFNNGSNAKQTADLNITYNLAYDNSSNTWVDISKEPVRPENDGSFDYTTKNGLTQSNIFAVNAEYYDYLSDEELKRDKGWLNPIQAGTGFEGSENNWYPFWTFNKQISELAKSNPSWQYPLYFGNFCNTGRAYMGDGNDHGGKHDGTNASSDTETIDGVDRIKSQTTYYYATNGLTRWNYFANNSNALAGYHYAIRGLALDTLNSNKIQVGSSTSKINMPYFDSGWLGDKAKKIKSYFPFRISTTKANDNTTDVTQYIFTSAGATDNVYFTWNSKGEPDTVRYGSGTDYGIEDGYKYFMGTDRADYKEEDPYGIFPFNNKQGSNNRPGNSNLDYGFGIKLDIDFRVPKGGLLAGNTPVTFEYSGDDDLWVYLTDDQGNSTLALDLGGNHKMTEGKLDFSTMTATSTNTAEFTKDKSKMLFIYDDSDNPNYTYRWDTIYMWAWGSNFEGEWFELAYDENTDCYYGCQDQVGTNGHKLSECTGFKLYGEQKTDSWYKSDDQYELSDSSWNKAYALKRYDDNKGFWLDTNNGSGYSVPSTSLLPYFTSITEGFGFEKADTSSSGSTATVAKSRVKSGTEASGATLGSGNFKTLDPNRTYHMTIFYMERGTLESNFEAAFTMTPVNNDFTVDKTVDVSKVNSALQTTVKKADDFNFTIKSGSSESDLKNVGEKEYTKNNTLPVEKTAEGVLSLGDGDSAFFNNQFNSGNYLSVTEGGSTVFDYTTEWKLVDNNDSSNVKTSNDGKTATFQFGKSGSNASYALSYINKPSVGNLSISKSLFNSSNDEVTDDSTPFTVQVEIDLDGQGDDYNTYALACNKYYSTNTPTTTNLSNDGTITLQAGEKVTIEGLPQGATYRVKEINIPNGYQATAPEGIDSASGVEGTIGATESSVAISNKKKDGSATVSVIKKLDYTAYKGKLFNYTLQQVDKNGSAVSGGTSETLEESSDNGLVTFSSITYSTSGTYYYKITEAMATESNDYQMDSGTIYAKVKVKDDFSSVDVTYCKLTSTGSIYLDSQTFNTEETSKTFNNKTTLGKVSIVKANKLDENGNADSNTVIKDAVFAVYEVKDSGNIEQVGDSAKTDADGKVVFSDLKIKDENGNYIKYIVKEIQAPAGYVLSDDAKFDFTFEKATYQDGYYTVSSAIVNPLLTVPDAGDTYTNYYVIFGSLFIAISLMGGLVYLYFTKRRPSKERFIAHRK